MDGYQFDAPGPPPSITLPVPPGRITSPGTASWPLETEQPKTVRYLWAYEGKDDTHYYGVNARGIQVTAYTNWAKP